MIIVRLMGGLGNQLQQYALYTKLISMGREVYLDTSWFQTANQAGLAAPRHLELNLFEKADYREASFEHVKKIAGFDRAVEFFGDAQMGKSTGTLRVAASKVLRKMHLSTDGMFRESDMYHPEVLGMDDVCLEGYWAAEKYYSDVLPLLRDKLSFDTGRMSDECISMSEKINAQESCAVHIRRGDYLDPINAQVFGGIATEKYYDAAIEYIKEKNPETIFYIFSDDQEYIKEKYGADKKCVLVDVNHGLQSMYDIYLMSLCDYHICANSTFSFWGVRLSKLGNADLAPEPGKEKINIRPYIHKNSQNFVSEEMHELWPGYILMDPEGCIR